MLSWLNTELHEKTWGIKAKKGFELYRLVYNTINAIPDNFEFHGNCQVQNLAAVYAPGVKNLNDLYGVRLTLKEKDAEYKKAVGKAVLEEALWQLLWN